MNLRHRTAALRLAALVASMAARCALAQGPGPNGPPDLPLDAATRNAVVEQLAHELDARYVDVARGAALARTLRARVQARAYDAIATSAALADRLNADLEADSHDKHLHVEYSPDVFPLPVADAKPDPAEAAAMAAQMKRVNYGFDSVQRLPFNIGYFKLDLLMPPAETEARFAAAMTLLQDTRALVIDLRENHGGEPATVALLGSYLFDKRTHLNDIWHREGARTDEAWTHEKTAGPAYGAQRAVIVLTSHETFSAGEDLAYALKTLHRATLIGETTGGGAHPGDMHRIGDHFEAFIPDSRSISPITHADWEGVGVTPDVSVAADKALVEARKHLLKSFAASEKNPRARAHLQEEIDRL
ncbi:MAG: S41 family peptidase [Betaproteobacteria bacterium]